jgi:hypothetical protein
MPEDHLRPRLWLKYVPSARSNDNFEELTINTLSNTVISSNKSPWSFNPERSRYS